MSRTKKHIGIIGLGMIAQSHIKRLIDSGRAKVQCVADINPVAVDSALRAFGIAEGVTDYREMLAMPDIDAVIIATPPFLHKRMFIDALDAGKHVLVEKPLALSPADCTAMVKAARARPRLTALEASCRHSRLNPKFAYVKELIDSGALGDVYLIHHNSVARQLRPGIEWNPSAKWFLNRKLAGGGPMIDWGVYDLSFHLGVVGDRHGLTSMRSSTMRGLDKVDPGTPIFDVEEHGWAFMEFNHGLTYYWERASNAHNGAPNETRIYGTRGGIKLAYCTWDAPEVSFFDVTRGGKGKPRVTTHKVSMKGHVDDNAALMEHFVDCLYGKSRPLMPVERAAKHLAIALRAAG